MHTPQTETVDDVLQDRSACQKGENDLVERTVIFVRQLKKRAGTNPQPMDKASIDDLYEDH